MITLLLASLLSAPVCNPSQLSYTASGGVKRAVCDKLSDVVSVKDFGAKGDGVTDDTAAVALAYAATASTGGAPGACIGFPAGKFKFNLTIARGGVCIRGAGRARIADTTPVGGTIFVPADLTKPIIQVGDGTALTEKVTLSDFSMLGDGTFTVQGTSTSDGLVIDGAANVHVNNYEIGAMGGRCIYLTSSAARSTEYIHFTSGEAINCSRYGVLADYGSTFTTAVYFDHFNCSPGQLGSGDYCLRLEGVSAYFSNSWFQVLNGHAHIYLLKDAGGHSPNLQLTNTFVDTGGNLTWTAVDINIGGAHGLIPTYISGISFGIDGQVRWDDATVVARTDPFIAPQQFRIPEAKIQQKLYFDLWQGSGGTEFNDSNTPALLLQGIERTTGGTTPILKFSGGHFQVPGTFGQALQFPSAAIWRNATTTRLHYRPDFGFPGNDIDGAPLTSLVKALTYSASMTPVADQGSRFLIAATNGTAFTINNPTVNAVTVANFSDYRLTITISNTSGGVLGAATFGAAYKMSAWVQPATGFQRSIIFAFDGVSAWYEIARTAADVPN